MLKVRCVAACILLAAGSPTFAQRGGDLQAQIIYAFQTEDLNRLHDLVENLDAKVADGAADADLRYQLAHAQYRYAEVGGGHFAAAAQAAAADCVAQLQWVLERNSRSVEALALQSACYAQLADWRRFEAVFLRARAAARLRAAFRLAPRNPRVLLLMATEALAHASPASAAARTALKRLRTAARLFERLPATRVDAPGWGHAEAYLALGKELRLRGDLLGARNWVERALIAAPDYKAAQREISLIEKR
ncbi:MAG TPA: hypothetical protein VMV25_01765 [Steroidobacteraceae bacterium]|nr:hypothetical protein [Steroidobacteraceae bacterium]